MTDHSGIDESTAAGLIKQAYRRATTAPKKFDLVVHRVSRPTYDDFVAFRFYVVKHNKSKSATMALGELVLKDVVSKLVDHFNPMSNSDLFGAAQALGSSREATQGFDMSGIRENATRLGGQMQLRSAKKMGPAAYNNCLKHGAIAHVYHCGVAKFEVTGYPMPGLAIELRGWIQSEGKYILQSFGAAQGGGVSSGVADENALSDWKGLASPAVSGDYIYDPAAGRLI